jgi:hypothetical protein
MDASLNIVDLIENNPIARLSGTYQHNMISKIQSNFSGDEQQMFVASFYCFLNYNQRTDFIIDLDNIWKWLGFSQKYNAKYMLEKQFVVNVDYKVFAQECSRAKKERGGHNKETILLTIRTFKLFCLKAGTKKADKIHEYYVKLEEILQDVIQEESNELRIQLENKNVELGGLQETNIQLQNQVATSTKEKDKLREKTILEQFPNNSQCVYYGIIDNVGDQNEPLIKFGNSNNLKNRVKQHRDTYQNFVLVNAFKVENKLQIENAIKENAFLKERHRELVIKNKRYVELLCIDGISFDEIDKVIKDIIIMVQSKSDDYIKLLEVNRELTHKLEQVIKTTSENEISNLNKIIALTSENTKLKVDNLRLIKKYNTIKDKTTKNTRCKENVSIIITDVDQLVESTDTNTSTITTVLDTDDVIENVVVSAKEVDNYGIIRNTKFQGKRIDKSKDGKYHVDDIAYDKLFGTRQEVWDGGAYKTSGELVKDDMMINTSGKLVSKKKSVSETTMKRFELCGVNQRKET